MGQGLAGSCLALQLLNRGKKILVFDEPERNRASVIAAGLFNPITGKRMSKSWRAAEIFSFLFQFYRQAEQQLNQSFFHPMHIYRPFVSIEEQNEWMSLSEEESVRNFIEKIHTSSAFEQANDSFGGLLISKSGYLDVNSFLKAVKHLLEKSNSYSEHHLVPEQLALETDRIKYTTHTGIEVDASGIIFCDGLNVKNNFLFHWVPIRPLKGETLAVYLDRDPEVIFNRGVYLVPTQKDKLYMVGATYQPSKITNSITAEARTELEEKLMALINTPFRIDHQNWGIRPTSPDRRPILGSHPIHKNVFIFNGLGTKGVSLAPYFSNLLADRLEGKSEIINEVNIDRFKALYSSLFSS